MADGKKTKGRSSSDKVKRAGKKSVKSEAKKIAARENVKDVTGNIVVLAEQKKAKAAASVKSEKDGLKKVENKVETNTENNTMEKKMSKTNAANPFDKLSNETMNFGKEYSEALAKSGQIFAKGFEDILGAVASLVQSSAEKNAKFVKEAISSKTINEFAEVQSKMAQAGFDDFMSGATKISELSVKVLTEGSEPVNAQITKAMQKASSLAA